MRYLPYLLVGIMTLPIAIWAAINLLVVKSSTSAFSTGDLWMIGTLAVMVVAAFIRLATWMDAMIQRTRR